jgi:hypothetical protein
MSVELRTNAINAFIIGCKADGTWDAIKAACILAGWNGITGALVPLKGTAPTNFNFVAGDYNRTTGLVGNGTTKYLNSNRNNNADPQDSNHNAAYVSTAGTATAAYMGASVTTNSTGDNNFGRAGAIFVRNRTSLGAQNVGTTAATGLIGTSRSSSASFTARASGSNTSFNVVSQIPFNGNVSIFASGALGFPTNARIAFYSIGESINLALLDARVTTLINTLGAIL